MRDFTEGSGVHLSVNYKADNIDARSIHRFLVQDGLHIKYKVSTTPRYIGSIWEQNEDNPRNDLNVYTINTHAS